MRLYKYYFFEGDEGVVLAHSWEEAKELIEEEYRDYYTDRNFEVVHKMTIFNNENCLLYEVGEVSQQPMLFCTREF